MIRIKVCANLYKSTTYEYILTYDCLLFVAFMHVSNS